MLESWLTDPVELLKDAPIGQYLVERRGIWFLLWRLTDGEPPDGSDEPAEGWALLPA
jgi:hypothetical protein